MSKKFKYANLKKKGIQHNITILRGWVKVQQIPSPPQPHPHPHPPHTQHTQATISDVFARMEGNTSMPSLHTSLDSN
jgi:hypothetical protein